MPIDYFAQQFGEDESETTPDYNQMMLDAYATIGRTGVGNDASQVDPEGLAAWTGALERGEIKPEDLSTRFQAAVQDYIATNPDDKYTQYVNNYLGNTSVDANANTTANTTANTVADTTPNTRGALASSANNTTVADNTANIGAIAQADSGSTTGNTSTSAMSAADARALMEARYATIGRTGVGTGANQIDEAGLNAWTNALVSGEFKPEDLNTRFSTAVIDYMAQNPTDKYTNYVKNYLGNQTGTATTGALATVANNTANNTVNTATTGATTLNNNSVVALGDSTTFGYNNGNQLDSNMVTSAQSALGNNYTVQNLGVNSTTVGDLLNGSKGTGNNWANTLASNAGIVVLNYGLNEASRGEDPATFAANLTRAVNELKAAGKTVILQTPNVVGNAVSYSGDVSTYANVIRDVASATGSALDDKFAATSVMGNIFDTNTADDLHPSGSTYNALGVNLANTILGLKPATKAIASGATTTSADTTASSAANQGVIDLYRTVLGREPDEEGLKFWNKELGSKITPEGRARFELSAQAELDSRIQDLYSEFLGSERKATEEDKKFWANVVGNKVDASDKEKFRTAAALEFSGAFGADVLAGFKYAKDLGISDAGLKATLGEDLFNQYKNQLKSTATTSITDIVADNSLTFEESQKIANLARDLNFNSQQLADLTGKDKALFDTILTSYDTNRTKIIKDTLTGVNVLTDADRVLASYALEKQFGFTDADIAKATGVDVKVIQDSLKPVRNFETDFSKIANNTDSTTQQIKDFVISSKANGAIDKLYGSALTGYENKIAELETKWSPYGSDAIQSENLFQQLDAQKNALGGQYFKGVFGDLQNSAALLVKKGLDTLGDLGQKDKFTSASVVEQFFTADGKQVSKQGDEYVVPITDIEGNVTSYEKVDPSSVTKRFFKYDDDGQGNTAINPLTEKELATVKDGKYQQKIGSVVIDKDTGAEITDTTGQLAFQKSGGVFTGKNHYLNANFTAEGTPYLTASSEKTGIYGFVDEMGPMVISIAAMIPGPHQPFAMMANAALAVSQKNYLGAVLSGLNAAGSFTGSELTMLTTAEAAGDIINTSRVLDLQNTASNIKLAQTAVSGFAALKAENIAGVINASLSAYGQSGGTLPSGVTTAFQAANLAIALDANNVTAALNSLGDLTGSKDFYVAASAKNLIDALKSGNETNIVQAGIVFGNAFQATNASTTTNSTSTPNTVTDNTNLQNNNVTNVLTNDSAASGNATTDGVQLASVGNNVVTDAGNGLTLNGVSAKTQADLDAMNAVNKIGTTGTNLAGDEFSGIDAQAAANAKANNTVIGNTEADTVEEATALAKSRNPTGTTFTYGGNTYRMGATTESVDTAINQAKTEELKNNIANASTRDEAFRLAREGGLGAKDVFTWQGKSYTAATADEVNKTSATTATGANATITNYVADKLSKNLTSAEFNPADLTKDEMANFVSTYANATDAQKATLLKGADSMTFKVIDTLLKQTAALNPTGAGDVAAPAGSTDLKAWNKGSIATAVDVAKTAGNIAAADIAGLGVRGAQFLGDLMGQDTNAYAGVQNLLVLDKDKSMSKLVGNEKVVAGGIASGIESAVSFTLGGPYAAVATIAGVVANNSWVEGSNAGLSVTDNAKRTAAITSIEVAGELLGIPGMKAIMKGIPVTGSVTQIVDTIKRLGGGLISENASELLTTVAQFGVDKFATFGLSKDATFSDFQTALKDTIIATTAAVGTSSGIATSIRAASGANATQIADADRTAVAPDTSLLTSGASFGAKAGDTSNQGLNQVTAEAIDFNSLDQSKQTSILDSLRSNIANIGLTAALTLGSLGSIANATEVESYVSTSIQQAASTGLNVQNAIDTSVSNSINSAVTNKVNSETAINSAVSSAVTTAIANNVNASSAINFAVTSAVNTSATNTASTTAAVTSAVNAAVSTAISTSVANNTMTTATVNAAVNTAVNSAVQAAVANNVSTTTAVNTAVTAAVQAAVANNVSVANAVQAAVASVTNLNVNVATVTALATTAANDAIEKKEQITVINNLLGGSPTVVDPDKPVTPATPITPATKTTTPTLNPKTPSVSSAGLVGGAIMAGELGRLPPQMLKAYMTQDKFVDPLAQLRALQEEMNTEKMPELPKVNTQEEDMPDQGTWKYGNAPEDLDALFGEKEEDGKEANYAAGGYVAPLQMASGGMPLPLLAKSGGALGALPRGDGRMDFRHGAHVAGEGDGQSDDIKAMLADGEFVFPADVVSALGNGSTKAGSDKLYEMMHSIRAKARSKKPKDLPPPALKSPLDYLKKVRS
jgi:hypothetical protein